MKTPLALVFAELLREVESNPDLRARIERHLTAAPVPREPQQPASRPRNRRAEPALDPYTLFPSGVGVMQAALEALTVEQLKDVIAGFGMDSSRLALKWKDQARLVEHIVTTVRGRMEKGDAFRDQAASAPR